MFLQNNKKYDKINVIERYDTMTNIKKNERFIPIKNYFIAFGLVIVVIALTIYGFKWYNLIQDNKLSESYLVKEDSIYHEIKNLEEVDMWTSEVPAEYYIYISYTGSKEIYEMEIELKEIIDEYNLKDSIYYLNVKEIKDENNYLEKINNSLGLNENIKVTKVPTIIYFKDGKAVDIISVKDDNIMNKGDFQKLLDNNNVKKGL